MYLSRLILDPASRNVRRDLGDCQQLHRTLLAAFPQADAATPDGARARFGLLFRVEPGQRGTATVLAQSHVLPIWEALPRGYLLDTGGMPPNPATKDVGTCAQGVRQDAVLRFRLRANPTRRVGKAGSAEKPEWKGKRVDLRGEEQQVAWLKNKGVLHGFRLHTVQMDAAVLNLRTAHEPNAVHQPGRATAVTGERRGAMRLTFGSVLFDGVLEVTDADAFAQALATGIGSGKAYGFGLLSVAPADLPVG